MSSSPQIARSALDLMLLSVLAESPQYGYAIIKQVAARSHAAVRLTPGALYPLLHRLERDGLLTSDWEEIRSPRSADDAQGRKRKWYRLSAKGRRHLARRAAAHRAQQAILDAFLPPAEQPSES